MDLTTITPAVFKAYFTRDFASAPTGISSDPKYVSDTDIQRALNIAMVGFNQGLFDSDSSVQIAFLLYAAHFLVLNLGMANGGGIPSNQVSARTVGNVSETYQISTAFINNPILSALARTSYGLQYLEFITPYLVGGVGIACGTSQA